MGKKKKVLCQTGKKRYKNEVQAMTAASRRLGSQDDPPDKLRIYRCDECKGWHLTRMALVL